jgi:ergothioneine biosynthesis protein EgtB
MATTTASGAAAELASRFQAVRRRTLTLCATLSPEDMLVQSAPETSPVKWHLVHTAWFFEQHVLLVFDETYVAFDEAFLRLFDSLYASVSEAPWQRLRASFARPGLDEILRYRAHVDTQIGRLLSVPVATEMLRRVELAISHEELHQEQMLADLLHAFYTNPLAAAYSPNEALLAGAAGDPGPLEFLEFSAARREVGYAGAGFCYDNELPRHRVWLETYSLADRLITCGEYAAFIADGGYRKPELWLADGWDAVEIGGWQAPQYWMKREGEWSVFTLHGALSLASVKNLPVTHVSFYEAEAFARWVGARLPGELEWEAGCECDATGGNLLDSGRLLPAPAPAQQGEVLRQALGDAWEWTASAYTGYPGYRPGVGIADNGRYMSGKMVLRGGSCLTPARHIRPSYRNFLTPETRHHCTGIRLAY